MRCRECGEDFPSFKMNDGVCPNCYFSGTVTNDHMIGEAKYHSNIDIDVMRYAFEQCLSWCIMFPDLSYADHPWIDEIITRVNAENKSLW